MLGHAIYQKHALCRQPLTLKGNQLNYVDQYKYLGFIFCPGNILWSEHINLICNRVRRLVDLLYSRFYEHSSSQTLFKLYCSFICPLLEYMHASVVWSSHLVKDKTAIEKVQHFALRVCLKDWSLGYDEALDLAHLPSLLTQRSCWLMLHVYNIVHNNMDFESAPVQPRPVSHFTRHSNNYQFQQPCCHTNAFQNS